MRKTILYLTSPIWFGLVVAGLLIQGFGWLFISAGQLLHDFID